VESRNSTTLRGRTGKRGYGKKQVLFRRGRSQGNSEGNDFYPKNPPKGGKKGQDKENQPQDIRKLRSRYEKKTLRGKLRRRQKFLSTAGGVVNRMALCERPKNAEIRGGERCSLEVQKEPQERGPGVSRGRSNGQMYLRVDGVRGDRQEDDTI